MPIKPDFVPLPPDDRIEVLKGTLDLLANAASLLSRVPNNKPHPAAVDTARDAVLNAHARVFSVIESLEAYGSQDQ
jgi:hypothetical protein